MEPSMAQREIEHRQVVLAMYSRSDGPWTAVSRLRKVEMRDATKDDAVRVEFGDHDLRNSPDSFILRGNITKHLNFPKGQVRVVRVSGTSPVTVLAHCERYLGSGNHTNKRHGVR